MSVHELGPPDDAERVGAEPADRPVGQGETDLRLVAEVDATRAVVDDLRGAMARLEGITGYLQERLEAVSSERDRLALDQQSAQAALAETRSELARIGERAAQEQNRRFTLESEVDDLRSDLAGSESEVDRLRAEVSRLEVANAELVTQRSELAAQRARKYRQLPLPGAGS